jgi:hypothetical protein
VASTEEQRPLDVAEVVSSQAWLTASRYRGLAEKEDLEQEAWCWILEHPSRVKELQDHENSAIAAYRLGQDVWKVMERYARKEKAARGGYAPEDDLFVSDAVISVVLPSVLKGDPTPPVRDGERVANTSDPAEGGNWLATFMDVKRGWERADLTGPQRDLLVSYYRDGMTQLEIANALKLGQPAVTKRLKQARLKIINQLGGLEPKVDEPEVRSHPGAKTSDAVVKAGIR